MSFDDILNPPLDKTTLHHIGYCMSEYDYKKCFDCYAEMQCIEQFSGGCNLCCLNNQNCLIPENKAPCVKG